MRILAAIAAALLGLLALAWVALHAHYDSWHSCEWLLRDSVDHVLRQGGVDPDTASIPLKASTIEGPYVQAVLRLRNTPAQCLGTWLSGRIFP